MPVTFAEPSSAPTMLDAYQHVSEEGWIPIHLCNCLTPSAAELRLITWNLNAGGPTPTKRFTRILNHLRLTVFEKSDPKASCILFQEVHVEILQAMLDNRWIREHFVVTPKSGEHWTTAYGLVSLISKDIPVSRVFYIELPLTRVGRHALFIDIHLSSNSSSSSSSSSDTGDSDQSSDLSSSSSPSTTDLAQTNRTLRIANTHLEPESGGGFRIRPKQLRTIAQMLNVDNVHAFICAGSMVSVQDVDHKAPGQLGLADAFKGITVRGSETWGRSPHQLDLPPGRLDKILYFPTEWVEVGSPRRIGDKFMATNEVFPSDHFGLLSEVKVKK